MITLICGPSGSGKTTLLRHLKKFNHCKIASIAVCRVHPRADKETGKNELSQNDFDKIRPTLSFIYSFNDSIYGFSLGKDSITSEDYVFLDYPGEYPECKEFRSSITWKGILVLPPCRDMLVQRLMGQGKMHRIASAVEEYEDCIAELQRGEYGKPHWRVYISGDNNHLDHLLADAAAQRLFTESRLSHHEL